MGDKLYFNQRVSPQLFRTKNPPDVQIQGSYYENHIEDRLEELNNTNLRLLENIDQINHMNQHVSEHLNTVTTQISDIKKVNRKQNKTHLKHYESQQALLQSISTKQLQIEQQQTKEQNRNHSLFQELKEKINKFTAQIVDIKNVSAKQNDTHQKQYETQQALLQSINEKQQKVEMIHHEDMDHTQLLFQELNTKVNAVSAQIDDINNAMVDLNNPLLENDEVQQALLQSLEERQLKIEQYLRQEINHIQSLYQKLNEEIDQLKVSTSDEKPVFNG